MSFHTNDARFSAKPPLGQAPGQLPQGQIARSRSVAYRRWIYFGVVAILLLTVAYISFSLYFNPVAEPEETQVPGFTPSGKPTQLDVLNGCGIAGAAAKISARLRREGFDVVEVRNYKSFDIRETLVVDRVGNLPRALKVASALGVARHNVVQEINLDYFVDVTVIIGRDFDTLH